MKRINGKYSILVFALLMILFSGGSLFAQNVTVRGQVTDKATGEPIPFATVFVKGVTTSGAYTDDSGNYTINVPPNAIIVYSYVGYTSVEQAVGNRSVINIALETDNVMLEEVVMVGFGSQRRAHLTGAVETVDTKTLETRPIVDLTQGLQGVSPGLSILYTSGQLNGEPTIRVRGAGSIVDGNVSGSPLVLVDGIPTPLSMVNPDDIENISILKDAASAAIYGARAAFGVVLISTKRGSDNENLRFSYTGSMGWSGSTKMIEHMDPITELNAIIGAAADRGEQSESWGAYHPQVLTGVQNWLNNYKSQRDPNDMNMVYGEDWEMIGTTPYFYRVWDVKKLMFSTNAPSMSHALNVSGKVGANTTIMGSIGFNSKEGLMKVNPENMSRYNFMFNVSTRFSKWLTGDVRVMASRQLYTEPYNYMGGNGMSGDGNNGYFGHIYRYGAYAPYGTYKGVGFSFAPYLLEQANDNERKRDYMRLALNLKAQITKDLTLTAEYSVGQQYTTNKLNGGNLYVWKYQGGRVDPNGEPVKMYGDDDSATGVKSIKSSEETYVFNAYARYTKVLNTDHNFAAQLGINSEWQDSESTYSERRGLLNPEMPEFPLAVGSQWVDTRPYHNQYSIFGIFGRINYDYKGRYLLELIGRYDGSSRFPTNSQWGFFPSASVGWRVTEESFMQNIKNVVNNAKLRFSVGSVGNERIRANAFDPMMTNRSAYWLGDGLTSQSSSYNLPYLVTPDLTWEKVVTYDIGLDLSLFKMFNIVADIYQRNTIGMLASAEALPGVFGTDPPLANVGDLRTRGYELSLGFNKAISKDFTLTASVGLSNSETIVTKYPSAGIINTNYSGKIIGEIWGLESDRLLQASDFSGGVINSSLPNQTALQRATFIFRPGDMLYKDQNGDGIIDGGAGTIDDHGDLIRIGNNQPKYEYNFRLGGEYKGFDLNVFFQGVGKRDLWASSDVFLPFYRGYYDLLYSHMTDYWTPTNTDAYYTRLWRNDTAMTNALTGVNGHGNNVQQTKYLLNLAYLRLKNLTVGYTLPRSFTSKIDISRVRVYFSGENLFTVQDKLLPIDPELTQSEHMLGRSFPLQRTISVGIQVNF